MTSLSDKLNEIRDSLASIVGSLDTSTQTGPEAEDLLVTSCQIERFGTALKTAESARVAESNVHVRSGHRRPVERLAELTGESTSEAAAQLALGQVLEKQPAVKKAYQSGELSKSRVKTVSDAARVNPARTDDLLKSAHEGSMGELQALAANAKAEARSKQSDNQRYQAIQKTRFCRTWTDKGDGSFRLDAKLTPDAGARVRSVLAAEVDKIFDQARQVGEQEPYLAYAADALVNLVTGEDSVTGAPSARKSSVHVRVDLAALQRGTTRTGEVCEIPGIGPIPVDTAIEVMGDALVRLVITDGFDVSTICSFTRPIPTLIKVALLERDPTCVVPGCDRNRYLEIDHWKVAFAQGGPTALHNLARLCSSHHRMKTTDGFRLWGGPGNWHFDPP